MDTIPTVNSGLQLWLDAADIDGDGTYNSAYSDGDSITTWTDKSGKGNNATEDIADPGDLLTYSSSDNAVLSESGDRMVLPHNLIAHTNSSEYTIFYVLEPTEASGTNARILSLYDSINDTRFQSGCISSNGEFYTIIHQGIGGSAKTGAGVLTVGSTTIITSDWNGSNYQIWVDGTSESTGTTSSPTASYDASYVGSDHNQGGYKGMYKELLIYDREMTETERQQVEAYLATKWGTTLPFIPGSLTLSVASNTQIDVSWGPVYGAAGYYLYNSTTGVDYDSVDVGNVFSYSYTGLTAETTYYYKFKAYNTAGSSDYSSVASDTTEASLETPTLVFPDVDYSTYFKEETFIWSSNISVDSFRFVLDTQLSMITPLKDTICTDTQLFVDILTPYPCKTYYWQVTSYRGSQVKSSNIDSFYDSGLELLLDSSDNLVASVNACASAFYTADYIVYDWRVDSGSGFESFALLNMPMETDDFRDFSMNSTTITNYDNNVTLKAIGDGTYYADIAEDAVETNAYFTTDIDYNTADGFTIVGKVRTQIAADGKNTRPIASINNNPELGLALPTDVSNAEMMGVKVYRDEVEDWDVWHHWGGKYDGTDVKLFLDGVWFHTGAASQSDSSGTLRVGEAGHNLRGALDNFFFFPKAISDEQMLQLNTDYSKIVAEELTSGENWKVVATPITAGVAGTPVESNEITIP